MKKIIDKKILIIGSGQHSNSVVDILTLQNDIDDIYIFDKEVKNQKLKKVNGKNIKILNFKEIYSFESSSSLFFVAIGDNKIRQKIFLELKNKGFKSTNIISKKSTISNNFEIGEGNFISNGVIINNSSKIGNNNIINTGVIIEHDDQVGSHNHLCPGVKLAGGVNIKNNVFIGMGSIIDRSVTIDNNCFISPGSIILKNLEKNKKILSVRNQIIKSN